MLPPGPGFWDVPYARLFPLGVFEDAIVVNGNQPLAFEEELEDLRLRGLDSVMFANNHVGRDARLLDLADRYGVDVYLAPGWELNLFWWPDEVPADIDTARRLIWPLVDAIGHYRSLRGYVVADEPINERGPKLALAVQAFREVDPERVAMPILIGTDRVGPLFATSQPGVLLIDVYPTAYANPPCDFTMHAYAYPTHDFVSYVREVSATRPAGTPLWMILQTHRFKDGEPDSLREPLPAELRAQQWLAVGEGATGLFWFIYSSEQGWIGLADNPLLFAEVTELTQRLRRPLPPGIPGVVAGRELRELLVDLRKTEDAFVATGGRQPYASTLVSADGQQHYVVAVNRDCTPQTLELRSATVRGDLLDLESGRRFPQGTPLPFGPGDGRVFAVVRR